MDKDLNGAISDEEKAAAGFEELSTAKKEEISAASSAIETKSKYLAFVLAFLLGRLVLPCSGKRSSAIVIPKSWSRAFPSQIRAASVSGLCGVGNAG